MFPCPACNQQVDKKALFCPHCGYQLRASVAGRLLTGVGWIDGLIGLILFFALPALFGLLFSGMSDGAISTILSLINLTVTPIVLWKGLGYQKMAVGFLSGIAVVVLLVLGLLAVCAVIMVSAKH